MDETKLNRLVSFEYQENDEHDVKLLNEIDEDDENLLEAFLRKDAGPQRTLADLIVARIKEKDSNVSSG